MFKLKVIICFISIFVVFAPAGITLGSQSGISIKGDRIDADLNQAPLRAVLADLSKRTGIQVHIEKGLEGNVSTKFSNLSLEKGLKRILSGYSSSMIFTKVKENVMISQIKVFKNGHSDNTSLEILPASAIKKSSSEESSGAIQADQSSSSAHAVKTGSAISSSSPGSKQTGTGVIASISKKDNIQLARLHSDITKMRRDLGSITDAREMAKARATLAGKTSQLRTREKWAQARIRGLNRLERQTAGH